MNELKIKHNKTTPHKMRPRLNMAICGEAFGLKRNMSIAEWEWKEFNAHDVFTYVQWWRHNEYQPRRRSPPVKAIVNKSYPCVVMEAGELGEVGESTNQYRETRFKKKKKAPQSFETILAIMERRRRRMSVQLASLFHSLKVITTWHGHKTPRYYGYELIVHQVLQASIWQR